MAALSPRTKTDLDKMGGAIQRLVEEDPTLRVRREVETGETIMEGMGESHIDVAMRKLQQKFGTHVAIAPGRKGGKVEFEFPERAPAATRE